MRRNGISAKGAFFVLVLLIFLAGTALSVRLAGSANSKPSPVRRPALYTPTYDQLFRIFVHDHDIYPDEIRTKSQNILLRAENEKLTDIELVIERVSEGNQPEFITSLQTVGYGKRTQQVLSLEPGEYEYYEQSKPLIRGRLIVEDDK
jgi:hypothetical protein